MKLQVIVGLVLLLGFSCAYSILGKEFVESINAEQTQWTATIYDRFNDMTKEQLKTYFGTKIGSYEGKLQYVSYEHIMQYTQLPENFDSRQQWGEFIHPIRDQGKCGSCWAFGATEALSDRFAIASQGQINLILSPQYLLSCNFDNRACKGGYLIDAWRYLFQVGVATEECKPYTAYEGGPVEKCSNTCANGSEAVLYKIKQYPNWFNKIEDAKLDILTNGPIEAGFTVYQDFLAYKSGIYKYTKGDFLGGHAIKMIGWGVENDIKYWICANSWGEDWGEDGFFRIQEGDSFIEYSLISGQPLI